jgi:hypothetical protein
VADAATSAANGDLAGPDGRSEGEQTVDEMQPRLSTAEALTEWRDAERTAAVARRGRVAAEAAAIAAAEAADAAQATAAAAAATARAAQAAVESALLAETSATKTAAVARSVVQTTREDMAEAESGVALTDVAEAEAHQRYRDAVQRALEETNDRS